MGVRVSAHHSLYILLGVHVNSITIETYEEWRDWIAERQSNNPDFSEEMPTLPAFIVWAEYESGGFRETYTHCYMFPHSEMRTYLKGYQ